MLMFWALRGELRSRICWAVRLRRIIVAAVFVLVREFENGFGQAEGSKESLARESR